MRILITGARGNYQSALIPRLLANGHELVLFDLEPMGEHEHCTPMQANIRDGAAVAHAMQGCNAVIHAAAYPASKADSRNYDDYFQVNVGGTHNILRTMLLTGIKHLVFSSTDDVYGAGKRDQNIISEELPCLPVQIHGQTKWLGEELCRFYARQHGFRIAMLRYGNSSQTDFKTAGLGRLGNWVDREDIAQANELAIGAIFAEEFHCEAFNIHCEQPFSDADWPDIEYNPGEVIERYYPGATSLLAEHGLAVPHIHARHDISKAGIMLGYVPEHNFEQFLSRLRQSQLDASWFQFQE